LSNEEIRAERKDQRLYISFASIVHKHRLGLFISELETLVEYVRLNLQYDDLD